MQKIKKFFQNTYEKKKNLLLYIQMIVDRILEREEKNV